MFRPGSVLKITMTNFVTYTYVEFRPGPNLNLVLGPNGTGKSTIVAAIILGLGGNPKIIGRGTKVSEYVKHGFSNASVEILLQSPGEGNTFTITREFDLNEKNSWKLNGKTTTQKDVCSFLKKLNIQVDNLCQFLPQDRVQDFTKMNKQELLRETKKALCRDDLTQKQEYLIEKNERHKALVLNLDKQVNKLQECQDMNTRLEGKVKNFNKKKKYQEHVQNIERKMAWVEYEMLASRRDEVKADKAQATEIYERHLNEAKPLENSISNAQRKIIALQAQGNKTETSLRTNETRINNHSGEITRMKESINEILNNMQIKMDDIEQREFEISSSNMKLDKLHSDKEEIINKHGTETSVKEKENHFIQEIRKMSSMITKIEQIKFDTNNSISERNYEIRAMENELRRIENVKQQRLEWLRRVDSDAYNATLWLRENKHRFSSEIYEPIVTELNVTNQENAVYIENILSVNDKIAFVCVSKEDMNLFIRLMRDQQHLKVNVIHSGEEHQSFQSYQPVIPIEQLKKYGFYAYAHSLFTGPEPIMKYLCRTYHIHSIPIGNNATNKCFDVVPKTITNFFSDKYRFSASYSRYTGEKSTKQSEINSDRSLSMSVDAVQLDHIKNEIREANRKCEVQRGEIQNLDNKIIQLNERKSKLTTELQALRGTREKIKVIESKIQMINDKLQDLRQKTDTKDSIKQEAYKEIENINKRILAVQIEMKDVFKSYTDLIAEARLNLIKINVCNKEVTFLKNKALEAQQRRQDAEETLNRIKNEYKDITAKAKVALQKAKNLSNGFTPADDGFAEFKELYDEMTDNLEQLMIEKEDVLSNIDCLHTADVDEMKEYEARVKKIASLKTSIEETNSEMDEISNNMDRLKEEYMQPLQELVNEISERFGAAFESMGYAGEVIVYTGKNDRDFAQYGLSIMVTYRNGQRLQELNSTTQSGGEKAVATATYLLSLQELTPVPFRCVDEINQGMDSVNERKIFELLVDSTSQPNTPQYFLITPKLLPNLKFVPTMKIHFVHNGPFMISQQQWNATKVY